MPREARPAGGAGRRQSPQSGEIRSFLVRLARSNSVPSGRLVAYHRRADAAPQGRCAGKDPARIRIQNRMPPTGRRRHERHQNKPAPMKLRMRKNQPSLHAIPAAAANYTPAEIQNIEIERPRFPMTAHFASGMALEPFQETQERARSDGTVHTNNHVQIIRLTPISERAGAVKWRACENVEPGILKFDNRAAQRNSGAAPRTRNIRPKTNPYIAGSYSQGMLPRTTLPISTIQLILEPPL